MAFQGGTIVTTHRVAVAVADGYPVAMAPVRDALAGVGEAFELPIPRRPLSAGEIATYADRLAGVEAILCRSGIFTRDLLRALPDLKVMCVHGAGYDQIDLDAATELGIVVTNAPGANADSVAELVIGFIVALLRRMPEGDRHVRERGGWREDRFVGRELRGRTLGVVGIGNVGGRVARLAQAFGAKVITCDPYIDAPAIPAGVPRVEYDDLLRRSDIVTFHVPLSDETRNMLDARTLRLTKPGVYVLNTSRGGVVNEDALADGLASGHVAGAALDVFAVEPPTKARPRVLDQPNLITSPHIGGSTRESLDNVARVAAEEIALFLRGEKPRYVVNAQVLAR
jgi:D-3-phosphoglycerate dehydrogenase